MAEAVLEVVIGNLNSLIQKELGLFLGVDRELERLSSILTTIRAVLEDAEEKQLTDRALKNWLLKLKDAAHLLDDILDECTTEALRLEYQGRNCGSAHKDFSLKRMLKAIIESASGQACEDLDLEPLQRKLQKLLQRRRYLLVLDDVWNENQEKWDRLKYVLAYGSKGASILVTTRLATVASIVETIPPHQLSMLSKDHCWELFRQRAFGEDKADDAELVAIGKEIVKKCKGVPLAAKALGSLLRFKSEENDWFNVMESEIWNLPQDEYSILPALRLSYLNLPQKTRQCFAYCALFPKDYVMHKELVIEHWMANGFISSDGSLEVEDIGDKVWNELYMRSFFQNVEIDSSGTRFMMHDLVHDLAQFVMEEECCCITVDNDMTHLSKRTRHLLLTYDWPRLSSELHQFKTLKTFILSTVRPLELPHAHDSLWVLEVRSLYEISSSIGHFKHLRYLNLSSGHFKTLPNSITRLWNLQILNLNDCYSLQMLPDRLKCLKFLRHLHLKGCISLWRLAPEIGQLNFLRTLIIYIVGKQRGFHLAELRRLNLNGKLHIKHLERVRSVSDAKEANMASKHLNELSLSWERKESQLPEIVEQILEALQPHTQKLRTLCVRGYMGVHYPQWMGSPSFKDLYKIELIDCKNCLRLPALGNLPSLKNLKLDNMNHVQYVDDDGSCNGGVAKGFKALKCLELKKLPSLVRLSKEDGENMFPCLSTLDITYCPKLSLPYLPSIKKLGIFGRHKQALLGSIQNLQSLESLKLFNNSGLTSFPDGMLYGLACLKELHIRGHRNLELLPTELNNLNALEELQIEGYDILEPLTEQVLQGLTSLKILTINDYTKFKLSAGFQFLTSLEDLTIPACQELEDLPEALQHLTTLQSLCLYHLPNLVSLPSWLGNLRSLQSLNISSCPKLTSLPMSIQCLGSLKFLGIYGCPQLLKRCEKEKGEDWHKVAHVPRIIFDSKQIAF